MCGNKARIGLSMKWRGRHPGCYCVVFHNELQGWRWDHREGATTNWNALCRVVAGQEPAKHGWAICSWVPDDVTKKLVLPESAASRPP